MDESYLEWLSVVPGFDGDKARRVAERFPTFERLRAASRAELASVEGLTPADLDTLDGLVHDGSGRDPSRHLFLCPECGSFAGTTASSCPFCGVEFEGTSEPDVERDLDAFLKEDERPARLCQTCGASMGPDETRCTVCGREYRRDELALLPGFEAVQDEASPFCTRCGAYLFEDEAECAICGTAVGATAPVNGKGVVKGFLSRWKRIAESGPVSEAERLQDELDHYDQLIEANPTLERAWANRAKVLEKLGRHREAAESYTKAAELNPAKESEYRIEVHNVLRNVADAPALPPIWKQPAATAAPKIVDPKLVEALDHYERLLHADPTLAVAWRTKGEILERLGRPSEASESFSRADRLERARDRSLRAAVEGLKAPGLPSRGPTSAGRVNGRVNGRTNGRVNGRTNGLQEGRVNGLTSGLPSGLSSGRGATNGLVNGDGFTNGRKGRSAPPRIPAQPHWSRSVVGIAAVVTLMVLVPILASFLSPSPTSPVGGIRIDGDFGDWVGIPTYEDSPSDQTQNPDVNLVAIKVVAQDQELFVNAKVQGLLFQGSGGPNATDALFVFVDEDNDSATGYPIGDLGADALVEVYGWRDLADIRSGVAAYRFNDTAGPRSDNWRRFVPGGSAAAAFRGQEIEIRVSLARDSSEARVLAYAADSRGARDPADGAIRPGRPTIVVTQTTVAPDIAGGPSAPILRIALAPLGGLPHVSAISVARLGSSADPAVLSVYRDDGSGALDAADVLLATAGLGNDTARFAVGLDLVGPSVFWVEARWANLTPASTFGLAVRDLESNGSASFRPPETGLVYLGAAPASLVVDGAFGDWRGRPYGTDLLGDVTNRTGAAQYNANVDILATALEVNVNLTGFVRVDGRMLGGEDIPTSRPRAGSVAMDTDLDTVPDSVEQGLGLGLDRDFNNNNVTDDLERGDVDADGILDHPEGPDCWLNTTIPIWYPRPFAGRGVSRYICPIVQGPLEGVEVVYAYIDADNSTATGLRSDVEGRAYGFDYAIAIVGRNGAISGSGLYAFSPGSANPWTFVRPVAAALDAHRIEFAADATGLNPSPGYRVVFFASDWRLGYDVAFPDLSVAVFPVGAQAATNVLINEVVAHPNPEWVELVNPTGSAISLSGWNLAIIRGKQLAVIYTFTSEVVGAWGSGTEYLRVLLPGNSLPNGAAKLVLRQGTTLVDQTSYSPQVGAGQSWARLKDPLTGVPMDSDNDAADFYISYAPSPGAANDRHRPTIAVAKVADRTIVAPGETITYTVYYNNTDTGLARFVWANDTLPAGVVYVSSSVPYASVSGSTYTWAFVNVLPNTMNSFTVTVQVTADPVDGQVLGNLAVLEYTDQLGRPLPGSQGTANTTVSRPMITIAKVASPANASPGDIVTFTIYYNNTGSAPAGTVSIKDALPGGFTYLSASPSPTWTDGRTFYWNFTNVAPGGHSLTLTAQVDLSATGTELVNWAFLNYTTVGGYDLASSSSAAVVAIPELADMIFVAAVPILIIGLRYRARRRKEKREAVADSVPRTDGR